MWLLEVLSNIGMSMQIFMKGTLDEEEINRKVDKLKYLDWFADLYRENKTFLSTDQNVRYLIGCSNIDKVLKSRKKAVKLKEKILRKMEER